MQARSVHHVPVRWRQFIGSKSDAPLRTFGYLHPEGEALMIAEPFYPRSLASTAECATHPTLLIYSNRPDRRSGDCYTDVES
jgi:hypothetical protein